MKIPANLTTPRIKLGYGEEVVHSFGTLRRKGIFGNRYGELHVTNQRVAFVTRYDAAFSPTRTMRTF